MIIIGYFTLNYFSLLNIINYFILGYPKLFYATIFMAYNNLR
jgi:hypothetical protein